MFLSEEIDIKLCPITKHIYVRFCIRFVADHIQQIRNQSENEDVPEELETLKFAPINI